MALLAPCLDSDCSTLKSWKRITIYKSGCDEMIYIKLFFIFYCAALMRGGYAIQQLFESLGYQLFSHPISFDIFALPDLNLIQGVVLLLGIVDVALYCLAAFFSEKHSQDFSSPSSHSAGHHFCNLFPGYDSPGSFGNLERGEWKRGRRDRL